MNRYIYINYIYIYPVKTQKGRSPPDFFYEFCSSHILGPKSILVGLFLLSFIKKASTIRTKKLKTIIHFFCYREERMKKADVLVNHPYIINPFYTDIKTQLSKEKVKKVISEKMRSRNAIKSRFQSS